MCVRPVSADLIREYCRTAGDPDCVLSDWPQRVAPRGILPPLDAAGGAREGPDLPRGKPGFRSGGAGQ
eukprot:4084942-Lingulodinium_polyedra.AAC.1